MAGILKTVTRGDIVRCAPPSDVPHVPLYQGNGRFGACFGPWGLHLGPEPRLKNVHGRTQFMHMQYHCRAKFNSDYLLPLARLYWTKEPVGVGEYSQRQSFAEGTITTRFRDDAGSVTITTWFDAVQRNVMGCRVDLEGKPREARLEPFRTLEVHYGQTFSVDCAERIEAGGWRAELSCRNARATLALRTNAHLAPGPEGVRLTIQPGRTFLLVGVNETPEFSAEYSLARTAQWWRESWQTGLWLDLPDDNAQRIWVRSMAYFLSTFNEDGLGFAPPMGFTGNGWPFNFPQDVSYIHPALLAAGRLEVARSWVERFRRDLDGLRDYTRRLVDAEGILCPWTYPYGDFRDYHSPLPPNKFYYETHNSGYLCRMAHETAVALDDPDWTRAHALPLIRETAAFYASICRKGEDGLWHIHLTPSMGQDEMGGDNQPDYLCALYSARYCFQTAIRNGLDVDERMEAILRDGLAFAPLLSERGFYYTCRGSGPKDLGRQKHPPQLNPLAFLPVTNAPEVPAVAAYRQRYDITNRAREPFFHGWTLGEFLLAGARLGDADGWRRDWANALPSHYVDADWIQIYETSGLYHGAFYTTTHGLFVQAILETLVSTWWDRLEIGRGYPWRAPTRFGGLRTLLGVTAEGEVEPDGSNVTLRAWKDAKFLGPTGEARLARGETLVLPHRGT